MTLTCFLVFLVSTLTLSVAVEDQDIIRLLRFKSTPIRSECRVSTNVAIQWDGADVATEKTVQYSANDRWKLGDFYLPIQLRCRKLGVFCRDPEISGWKVRKNWEIGVPLPPYTDSRWELLPLNSTRFCGRLRYDVLNSTYFAFSVKGDSVINIQFEGDGGDAGGVYGITLGDSVSSAVTQINRYNKNICSSQSWATGDPRNAKKWRHFWISVRDGNITVGHLNSTAAIQPISWADQLLPLSYKYMTISSRSSDETLWKLHNSSVLYIQKGSRAQGFLEGYVHTQGNIACISFWYYMTPDVGLSLVVHMAGSNHYVSSSGTFEWKQYVAYNPSPYASNREYQLSIEGIFPEDAPDDAVIVIDDLRKCGPNADTSHTSTIQGNNSLFCSLAFPPPPHTRIPCSKVCYNGGKCYDGKCVCVLGFTGKRCESGIPVCGAYNTCERNQVCSITTKQCVCSAGVKGILCNTRCFPGTYGPNCSGRCGRCRGPGRCDDMTGACPLGCQAGYQEPFCLLPLPYLKEGPRLEHATLTSLSISIRFGRDNYKGDGDPASYSVHHQKVGERSWVVGSVNEIPHSDLTDFTSVYVIENLAMGSAYIVRVVLFPEGSSTNNLLDSPKSVFETLDSSESEYSGQSVPYVIAGTVVIIALSVMGIVAFVLFRRYKYLSSRRGFDPVFLNPIIEEDEPSVTTVNGEIH